AARERLLGRDAEQLEHGRRDVDEAHALIDEPRLDVRTPDRERHAEDVLVMVAAVAAADALLEEALAVVREEHDVGVVEEPEPLESAEDAVEMKIGLRRELVVGPPDDLLVLGRELARPQSLQVLRNAPRPLVRIDEVQEEIEALVG